MPLIVREAPGDELHRDVGRRPLDDGSAVRLEQQRRRGGAPSPPVFVEVLDLLAGEKPEGDVEDDLVLHALYIGHSGRRLPEIVTDSGASSRT